MRGRENPPLEIAPVPDGAPLTFDTMAQNPPRDGFFEHAEYLKVRALLPMSFQDVLDFADYSGWRRNKILELTWDEVDMKGGVIRLPPRRSKTRTGRVLPISPPLQQVLKRRRRLQRAQNPRVFSRDGIPVRTWRTALRDACRKAKVPHRLLHDCRRTAARNLIRAGVSVHATEGGFHSSDERVDPMQAESITTCPQNQCAGPAHL
jgi:integrase